MRPFCTTAYMLEAGQSLRVYNDIRDIASLWDSLVPREDPYWSAQFLASLQDRPPGQYDFRYLVFYTDGQPVGVAYIQIVDFSAWRSISGDLSQRPRGVSLTRWFRKTVARILNFNALIVGNTTISGPYAFHFLPGKKWQPQQITTAIDKLIDQLKQEGTDVHLIAIKDLTEERLGPWQMLGDGYRRVCFQPRMIMHIPKQWRTMADYLDALQSKYRVRFRRARKKRQPITDHILTPQEMARYAPRMYALYQDVAAQSGFNMVNLDENYWLRLQEALNGAFTVRGYFLDGQLVGFYSMVRGNHGIWHANYLGYEIARNHSHQLYLNMLYDMIGAAISEGAKELDLSRTALEIKSSVGATPQELYCFFKYRVKWVNPLVPWLSRVIAPDVVWEQRHPFKD